MMAALRWVNPLTWVVDWPAWALLLGKASIWIALVWVALLCLRRRHPQFRALLCRSAVVSLAALAVLSQYGPTYRLGVVRPAHSLPATHGAEADATEAAPVAVSPTPMAPSPTPSRSLRGWAPSVEALALAAWLSVACILLVRLAAAVRVSAALANQGTPADDALQHLCRALADDIGLRRVPRVRVTGAVPGPMLAGVPRPTVLLPESLMESMGSVVLPGILAHELAHVRTRDLWWNLAFEAMCRLFWFNPAAWWLRRIHETACEEACDAEAVGVDGDAAGYRRTLASMALNMAGVRPGLAIPMARSAHIARRVRALANPVGRFRAQWRRAVAPGLVVMALVTAFAGLSCYRQGPAGLYERAPGTTDTTFTLKPTTFTLDAVARWNRDGSVRVEDGKGAPAEWGGPLPDRTDVTPYLDVADIKIGPDADVFDVTELRVFDHATQVMLGFNDDRRVTFVMDGHTVRVQALNTPLPDELDVWFRVRHRLKGDPVWILQPQAGTQVTIGGITVRVREIVGDMKSFRVDHSVTKPGTVTWLEQGDDEHVWHAVVDFIAPGNASVQYRFQLCAVDEEGGRLYSDKALSKAYGTTSVHRFAMDRSRVQRFEVRPLHEGGRPFYFEKVRLPQADPTPIEPLPALEFAIDGKEGTWTSDLVGPEAIRITTSRGRVVGGVCCPVNGDPYFTPPAKPDPTGTSVMVLVEGVDITDATMVPLDSAGIPLRSGSRSMDSACGHRGSMRCWHFSTELEEINRVRLSLQKE